MTSRLISWGAMALVWGCSVVPGFGASKSVDRQIEIGLWGSLTPVRILGTTTIQDSWSSFLLDSITEKTTIQSKARNGLAAGGTLSFFLSPHLGVQVLAGYGRADITTGANFNFAWAWADGTGDTKSTSWSGTGRLTRIPVCLNLVFREGAGPLTMEASGGLAYYWNRLQEESVFGYGVTAVSLVYQPPDWTIAQTVDALPVRLTIPSTAWTAVGADIGGSLSIRLTNIVGLKAEARYFYCPAKQFSWEPAVGTYNGLYGQAVKPEPFTNDDITSLAAKGQTFGLKTDPSFIQYSLGVTFFFGRGLRH